MSNIKESLLSYMPWYWVNYNINISLKHRYIYIEVPKVACTTIKKTLINWELDELSDYWSNRIHTGTFETPFIKPYQLNSSELENILSDSRFFKFTFVRSPYTRVLSCYLEKIVNKKPAANMILDAIRESGDDIRSETTFLDFLKVISEMDSFQMDSHFRPQHKQNFSKIIQYDFVGKFEQFEDDFSYVLNIINCNKKFYQSVKNHAVNAENFISEYYYPQEQALVNKIYDQDFLQYHYSKTLP